MNLQAFSRSERAGFEFLPDVARGIYSAGISTGGVAEIEMAERCPDASIVATTLDESGLEFSRQMIAKVELTERIETKLEDVSHDLPYANETFDYVYARLVLHYLSEQSLPLALNSLYRILKPQGRLYVVVRSTDCFDATRDSATYDDSTGLTSYIGQNGQVCFRNFHTQQSIQSAITDAGFSVESVQQYDEQLYIDYKRSQVAPHTDNLIELKAVK